MSNCQAIIKTLLASIGSNDSTIPFRELSWAVKHDETLNCNLRLSEFHQQYMNLISEEAANRINTFNNTYSDGKRSDQARWRIEPHLKSHIISNRSWLCWFSTWWG